MSGLRDNELCLRENQIAEAWARDQITTRYRIRRRKDPELPWTAQLANGTGPVFAAPTEDGVLAAIKRYEARRWFGLSKGRRHAGVRASWGYLGS